MGEGGQAGSRIGPYWPANEPRRCPHPLAAEIYFNRGHAICGASVHTYLLEKSRVVRQAPNLVPQLRLLERVTVWIHAAVAFSADH